MGITRNGARTFLTVIQKACKLSHLAGFRTGLSNILSPADATTIFGLWDPFCAAVELIIASDDWFNKKDNTSPSEGGDNEDTIAL